MNVIGITLLFSLLLSCTKDKVKEPNFDVSVNSLTFKVGDTIKYNFNGYADNISLYTGESVTGIANVLGYRYQYKNRASADGNAFLQFSSLLQTVSQPNTLSLLVSNDFSGIYDSANIYKATWLDLTNLATLSNGSLSTAVASGLMSIPDTFKNKPIFFAFRYRAAAGSQQPRWTITNFNAPFYAKGTDTANATKDTFTVATLNPAWRGINVAGSQAWSISTTQLLISGGSGTTAVANEDWAISRDFYLNRVPNDKPAFILKTYTDGMLTKYSQRPYRKPGLYKVTFVANNASWKNQKEVIKEFEINVTP